MPLFLPAWETNFLLITSPTIVRRARELLPMGNGILGPTFNGYSTLTRRGDTDWWVSYVKELSTVTLTGEWYQRLSNVWMELHADDPIAVRQMIL